MSEFLTQTELHTWREMLITPASKRNQINKEFPPDASGVYGLYSKDGELRYIGKSGNVQRRIGDHWNAGVYGRREKVFFWSLVLIPKDLMTDIETAHIIALHPIDNKRLDYSKHPEHMDMVDAIREAWGLSKYE